MCTPNPPVLMWCSASNANQVQFSISWIYADAKYWHINLTKSKENKPILSTYLSLLLMLSLMTYAIREKIKINLYLLGILFSPVCSRKVWSAKRKHKYTCSVISLQKKNTDLTAPAHLNLDKWPSQSTRLKTLWRKRWTWVSKNVMRKKYKMWFSWTPNPTPSH